ncbi:MAG: TetR/AcrR family transcriptional regulator [Pseudomonadales bacterium]
MAQAATKPKKREITRARVIQAAIDRIYHDGFHAAHTNRIAAQADVSWGVLQYHFGDKDGLLQAVLDHNFADFAAHLGAFEPGTTGLRQRIDALINLIWSLVSKPEYRVSVAILRNAGYSPDSNVDGIRQMDQWAKEIARVWDQLFKDIAITAVRSHSARRLMFASLRGFADELNPSGRTRKSQLTPEFVALGDAMHHLLTYPEE